LIDRVITRTAVNPKQRVDSLKGVRFASAPRQFLDLVDPQVQLRFEQHVQALRSEGAEVLEIDLGSDFVSITRSATWGIFAHETMGAVKRFLADHKIPLTFDEVLGHLSPFLRGTWEHIVLPTGAGYVSPEAYEVAVSTQRIEVQRRFRDAFRANNVDAILLPTTPCTAPMIEQQLRFSIAGQEVEYLALANNTVSASLAGLPGISVPAGAARDGSPIGLELDGQMGDDARLLEIASLVERVVASTQV
jgi:mandelamide amidase